MPGWLVYLDSNGNAKFDNGGSTFSSTSPPTPIPDLGTLNSTITVSGLLALDDLDVILSITHTDVRDLDVFLVSPQGTRVELFSDLPSGGAHKVRWKGRGAPCRVSPLVRLQRLRAGAVRRATERQDPRRRAIVHVRLRAGERHVCAGCASGRQRGADVLQALEVRRRPDSNRLARDRRDRLRQGSARSPVRLSR